MGMQYEFRLRKGIIEVPSEIYYFISYNEQCNSIFRNGKIVMGVYIGDSFAESCSYIPWNFTLSTFGKFLLNIGSL